MSTYIHGNIITNYGIASNNHGETEGNTSTLQKIEWQGETHTTVSSEAIRFALRRRLNDLGYTCNRTWNFEDCLNEWKDPDFSKWYSSDECYIDDDLFGFMKADKKSKIRKSAIEVTRAISSNPYKYDLMNNFSSSNATPSAQKKGSNPTPYSLEVHATRYQYGFTINIDHLRNKNNAKIILKIIAEIGTVAGCNSRYLYDFSPENIILRITQNPSHKMIYSFKESDGNDIVLDEKFINKIKARDLDGEVSIGGSVEIPEDVEIDKFLGINETIIDILEKM